MAGKRLAVVLGIRPDIIRASIVLETLRARGEVVFIWTGQHYSEVLKDVFFRQLSVAPPDIELNARGDTDADTVADIIVKLRAVLVDIRPEAVVFLGDTNSVMGCVAAAQLNLPIVHIEGCMRSYDWQMLEEKYRTTIDHLSDRIYAYLPEYKTQGLREGIPASRIEVVGNPIVDVLNRYYFARPSHFADVATPEFFARRGVEPDDYLLMTCHRRENVTDEKCLANTLAFVEASGRTVYFPASFRTQHALNTFGLEVPPNVRVVDPVGYEEFLTLMTKARGGLTDSGTVVEEACVLGVPACQMRSSTERPQVYDVGACVKFDPRHPDSTPSSLVYEHLEELRGRRWEQPFGDGHASERIASDLLKRLEEGDFDHYQPEHYGFDVARSFRGDGF